MKPILETFCIAYYLTGIQRFRFILYKNLTIRIYVYVHVSRSGNSQWIEIIDGEKSRKGVIYDPGFKFFVSVTFQFSFRTKNEIVTSYGDDLKYG